MFADAALTQKKDMLSELAFSGRHAEQSVWVLSQQYNSVLKDLQEQTRWVALFHMKNQDSFQDCLRENNVIPSQEERDAVRRQIAETKHSVLLFKNRPTCGVPGVRTAALWKAVSTHKICLAYVAEIGLYEYLSLRIKLRR